MDRHLSLIVRLFLSVAGTCPCGLEKFTTICWLLLFLGCVTALLNSLSLWISVIINGVLLYNLIASLSPIIMSVDLVDLMQCIVL